MGFLDDYNTVDERKREFFEKYPEGSLQSECSFTEVDGRWAAVVKASAYRTPDDVRPGNGFAYEFIPGGTNFTRDSELQNAETAAWGRAIEAVGASSSKKIASREEVRNRTAEPDNGAGTAALVAAAKAASLPMKEVAELFEQVYKHHPRVATNEDLEAFAALVRNGALKAGVE